MHGKRGPFDLRALNLRDGEPWLDDARIAPG